jgi:hypothetical protein
MRAYAQHSNRSQQVKTVTVLVSGTEIAKQNIGLLNSVGNKICVSNRPVSVSKIEVSNRPY